LRLIGVEEKNPVLVAETETLGRGEGNYTGKALLLILIC